MPHITCMWWVGSVVRLRTRLPDDADRVVCTFIDTGAYVRMGVPAESRETAEMTMTWFHCRLIPVWSEARSICMHSEF